MSMITDAVLFQIRTGMVSIRLKDGRDETPEMRRWLEDVEAEIRTRHQAAHAIGEFLVWCNQEEP